MTMSIIELYTFLLPLINLLGTVCLIGLVAGSVLYVMVWIIKRFWKGVVAVGVLSACAFLAVLLWGGV